MKRSGKSGWVGMGLVFSAVSFLMGCGGHTSLGEDAPQGFGGSSGDESVWGGVAGAAQGGGKHNPPVARGGAGGAVGIIAGAGGITAGAGGIIAGAGGTTAGAGGSAGGSAEQVACPCSRRPGANNSVRCPPGIGESASAVIGVEGGSIELTGQQGTGVAALVTIAPKQLSADQELTLTEVDTPPPAELNDYSPIYTLTGDVLPARISVRLPFGNLDGEVARDLTVYGAETADGPFVALPNIYVNAGFVEGDVDGYSAFLVAGARGPELQNCP
ncbi:MAG TPA: hypothetical protein VFQ61_20630 [Polyangiaceae bacterium]|nr:hypothetical protein [Polyangiaceae bacterium]